jgi:hypothetical protein
MQNDPGCGAGEQGRNHARLEAEDGEDRGV